MNVYMYQAALYCETCGVAIREQLATDTIGKNPTLDAGYLDDSDTWPQGPYADGGREADLPQHCDACHVFLENPAPASTQVEEGRDRDETRT